MTNVIIKLIMIIFYMKVVFMFFFTVFTYIVNMKSTLNDLISFYIKLFNSLL